MDRCCTYTYASLTFNGAETTDTMVIPDDASFGIFGLDGAPIRRQVDDNPQADGGDGHTAWLGARIITAKLRPFIGTTAGKPDDMFASDYWSKYMTLQDAVINALEGQLNSPTNLAWTPANGTPRSISCYYGMPGGEVRFGGDLANPTCEFTLIAMSPGISGAP